MPTQKEQVVDEQQLCLKKKQRYQGLFLKSSRLTIQHYRSISFHSPTLTETFDITEALMNRIQKFFEFRVFELN